jgi:hypothetical protein
VAVRNRRLAQLALFLALATLHTWPLASDPAHLSRLDNDDTAFNTWVVAWVAHQLPRHPLELFEAPVFYPEHHALAFSEHMIVQAAMGAPLQWAGVSPVLVFNLLVWLGFALSGFAMCVLVERWTASAAAGVVAGSLYAFNAHFLTRFAHLQALHVEFFPLVLYAFDRLLQRPSARLATLLAGAFVLQALCSNYTMVFVAGALLVAMATRPEPWRRDAGPLWLWLAAAGLLVTVLLAPFLYPYYEIATEQGMVRSLDEVREYSASWLDYLTTAGRLHYQLWAWRVFGDRTSLFPGVAGSLLALFAALSGVGWRDPRARMVLAFGVVGFALSFGPSLPGYGWMHEHVPLFQGIRAAARWAFLFLTAVAVLAGFGVAEWRRRLDGRSWWPAIAVALVGLVTLEAMRAPLALVRFAGIAAVHHRLDNDAVTGIIVFPLYTGETVHRNARYMLDQTKHWRPMINGYSSFVPNSFFERAARLRAFPSAAAIEELRSLHISHVVVQRTPFQEMYGAAALAALRLHPDLEFVLDQEGVVVYRVRREESR